ncbi:MAG: family 43 glycosylhydrolase [Rikenellaceae bacterium]
MRLQNLLCAASIAMLSLGSCCNSSSTEQVADKPTQPFPFVIPLEKPDFKLSASMERVYDNYGASRPQLNELYTQFKYTMLEGFDYNGGNGTITRRDPTRVIKVGDTYYVWYTLRKTPGAPVGAAKANDVIPSADWDLSDIGYATSKDGFTWEEQGVAVNRPESPQLGWRSVSTPEILVWQGKYYLYFQAFSEMSGKRGDDCPVAMAEADSPDGPWTFINQAVIPNGPEGTWDQYSIHDPLPIVFKDKIYLYYKSDYNGQPDLVRSQGLAVADNPKGPFVKCDVNPVLSSGHETHFFRFKEGMAAISSRDGHEHNTIQYSEDGINFYQASVIDKFVPYAGGFYDPDAFTNRDYARGVTWGISHFINFTPGAQYSILLRYDCDLSLDLDDPEMKNNHSWPSLDEVLKYGLSKKQKERIMQSM